jgi:hypothetical protein
MAEGAAAVRRAARLCEIGMMALLVLSSVAVFYLVLFLPEAADFRNVRVLYVFPGVAMLVVSWGLLRGRTWALVLAVVGSLIGTYFALNGFFWNTSPTHESAWFIEFSDRALWLIGAPFFPALVLSAAALVLRISATTMAPRRQRSGV